MLLFSCLVFGVSQHAFQNHCEDRAPEYCTRGCSWQGNECIPAVNMGMLGTVCGDFHSCWEVCGKNPTASEDRDWCCREVGTPCVTDCRRAWLSQDEAAACCAVQGIACLPTYLNQQQAADQALESTIPSVQLNFSFTAPVADLLLFPKRVVSRVRRHILSVSEVLRKTPDSVFVQYLGVSTEKFGDTTLYAPRSWNLQMAAEEFLLDHSQSFAQRGAVMLSEDTISVTLSVEAESQIDAEATMALLEQNLTDFTRSTPTPPSPSPSSSSPQGGKKGLPMWVYILGGVAVFIILGSILAVSCVLCCAPQKEEQKEVKGKCEDNPPGGLHEYQPRHQMQVVPNQPNQLSPPERREMVQVQYPQAMMSKGPPNVVPPSAPSSSNPVEQMFPRMSRPTGHTESTEGADNDIAAAQMPYDNSLGMHLPHIDFPQYQGDYSPQLALTPFETTPVQIQDNAFDGFHMGDAQTDGNGFYYYEEPHIAPPTF